MSATIETTEASQTGWDLELGELLEQLSGAQSELLALLATKRELLSRQDHRALAALAPQEHALGQRLLECQQRREELLAAAQTAGIPGKTLSEVAQALPAGGVTALTAPLREASEQSKLIRHECLAQWVVVQRTVLHLSQMLEIIASGGQKKPTYGNGQAPQSSGALMDQAV